MCDFGDRPHLTNNVLTMSRSDGNFLENVFLNDDGILGFSTGILKIWKSNVCTTELSFSIYERKEML